MLPLPELLVPAADPDKLDTALTYGADAVYVGGKELNLRAKSGGFSFAELTQAVTQAHARQCAVYFTLNLLAWEEHLPAVARYLDELAASGVDGIIIADPGVLAMAAKRVPHIPIHLSTQANTSNSASAAFWRDQGATRVNLARELGARRIRTLVENVSGLELEVFVHGAMCMAISGRCLLSAHVNERSANLGQCTHPCRFDYRVTGLRLEEKLRPGRDMWELVEGGEYAQIMSAEDLCLVKYLPWFQRTGVHSLKIEGRMKTSSYLAQVTDVYRTALDDVAQRTCRPALYLDELRQTATRPLSTGFFTPVRRTLALPLPRDQRKNIVARVREEIRPGLWAMDVKHRFLAGDPLEILVPGLRRPVMDSGTYGVERQDGSLVREVHSGLRLVLRSDHPDLRTGLFLRSR
ncbi:MAG: U32 family peptidase [Desulfovibrionales bacterium]|nr:U32 family peptidase [Desulfovibrionales bacterium]